MQSYSPFECPICYDSFDSSRCQPVTFPCGHTCCLNDAIKLNECFACRSRLPPSNELNKNIALIGCCEKLDQEVEKKLEYLENGTEATHHAQYTTTDEFAFSTLWLIGQKWLSSTLWLIGQKWVWSAALGAYAAYVVLRLYSVLCQMVGSFLSVFTVAV